MPIIKRNDVLVMSFKIPRQLHNRLDQIKSSAKKNNLEYDPTDALIKALEKDLDSAEKDIKSFVDSEAKKPTNHVDK